MIDRLSRTIDRLSSFCFWISCWLCLALVLLTTEQVVARYFFNASSVALQELEWHLFGLIFLLSAAHTLNTDGHVRVDLLYAGRSRRTKALIDFLGLLFLCLPACAVLFWYGWEYAASAAAFVNPRPVDHFSAAYFTRGSAAFEAAAALEAQLRSSLLVGEISPVPGGLEGRWLIKAAIPLCFALLFLQSISLLIKQGRVLIAGETQLGD